MYTAVHHWHECQMGVPCVSEYDKLIAANERDFSTDSIAAMGLPNSDLLRSFRHATHLTLPGMPAMGCRVTVIGSSNRVILSTHRSRHEEWPIFVLEKTCAKFYSLD